MLLPKIYLLLQMPCLCYLLNLRNNFPMIISSENILLIFFFDFFCPFFLCSCCQLFPIHFFSYFILFYSLIFPYPFFFLFICFFVFYSCCQLFPLILVWLLPDSKEEQRKLRDSGESDRTNGIILVCVVIFSLIGTFVVSILLI